MAIEHAYIALIEPKPRGKEVGRVELKYNPKEFSYTKAASWERKPAKGAKKAPPLEFKGAQPSSLTVEVFLDGYESGKDISTDIEMLTKCCHPLPETIESGKPMPPWVIFGWGTKVHITAYVKSVAVKCTMFDQGGVPLRAVCTVTMEEIAEDPAAQNPTSGSKAAMRSHLLMAGDTLASVAYEEYGEANRWRALAEANNLDDPMRLVLGTRLLIPELEALDGAPA